MAQGALPAGMVQEKARILAHRRVALDHHWMRLKSPAAARRARPGQFVHVRCGEGVESPLLRRPLSLYDADPRAGTFEFIYKVVGLGTQALSRFRAGEKLDFLGPLGNRFELSPRARKIFLVGGGVGIPPLYFLAKDLAAKRRGVQVEAFLGARTKEWVLCASAFRKLGVPVHTATDDGTLGYRGSVVDLLKRSLSPGNGGETGTTLCVCGPTPMMAAAAALAHQRGIPARVSLEERMGCAMGCCWGCVVEVATQPANAHARFQRVCTEGPVFDAEEILWEAGG